MSEAIQFSILAGMPLAAVISAAIGRKERPKIGRIAGAILSVSGGVALTLFLLPHTHRGQPFQQLLIAGFCTAVPLIWITHFPTAITWAPAIAAPVLSISLMYNSQVHEDAWTGDPFEGTMRLYLDQREVAESLRKLGSESSEPYPAGWLDECALRDKLSLDREDCASESVEAIALWHTWLTRLWMRRVTPVRLWYRGGPVSDPSERLEWRPSP